MAVKTKTQIKSEITSVLADNTTGDISASDVRGLLTDIVDSYDNDESFLSLDDTPASYSSKNNHSVKVNSAANALEFVAPDEFIDWEDIYPESGFAHGSVNFQMKLDGGYLHFKGNLQNNTGSSINTRRKIGTAPASLAGKIINKFLPVMIYDGSGNQAYFHGVWIYSNRDVYISKGGLGWKNGQRIYTSTSIINDANAF